MLERYIWGPQRDSVAYEGHILMSSNGSSNPPGGAHSARPSQVSVFRPGQPVPDSAITLDQRTGREIFLSPSALVPFNPARVWESITELQVAPEKLARNGLFPEAAQNPATRTFDMLRTRVLQTMAKRNWTRLAVTSPTHGCGKSFVAANLALSMARLPSCRTVLLDLELRDPSLADLFCHADAAPLSEFVMGEQPLESHFRRFGRNLALGLNGEAVQLSSELLQDPEFANAMGAMRDLLQPDMIVMDTPPLLAGDDVLSLLPEVDAVLLVVDGTRTTAEDVRACERLLEGKVALLGTVLNRAQDRAQGRYAYGQRG